MPLLGDLEGGISGSGRTRFTSDPGGDNSFALIIIKYYNNTNYLKNVPSNTQHATEPIRH
jgi:hypothetical protein